MNNLEVIRFSNERVRPFAELLARCYYAACELIDEFEARGLEAKLAAPEDWRSLENIFALPANQIEDGRQGEGITALTDGDLFRLYRMALWIKTNAEGNGRYMVNQALKASVRIK